jgi:hypothetical protein
LTVFGYDASTGSESPMPRASNRITRANDDKRRWYRATCGSSSKESIGRMNPVKCRRSKGPSPSVS